MNTAKADHIKDEDRDQVQTEVEVNNSNMNKAKIYKTIANKESIDTNYFSIEYNEYAFVKAAY